MRQTLTRHQSFETYEGLLLLNIAWSFIIYFMIVSKYHHIWHFDLEALNRHFIDRWRFEQ